MTPVNFIDSAEDEDTDIGLPQFSGGYDLFLVRKRRVWRPPTDVYETDSHVVVKVEIAGVQEGDLDISLVAHRLIIAGNRKDPVGKLVYQNMEISYGEFRTEVRVEVPLDRAAIEASYRDGFLFVSLPKSPKRRIPIRVRQEDGPGDRSVE